MTFEKFLAQQREYRIKVPKPNPMYADEYASELNKHLQTVARWLDPNVDVKGLRNAMADAMEFFGKDYNCQGVKIFRGAQKAIFDGKPASYTKDATIAEMFGVWAVEETWFGKSFVVIDRVATATSLDLSKLLKSYANETGDLSHEKEVIVYNTPVGKGNITEFQVER